jgi:hypothetical protein
MRSIFRWSSTVAAANGMPTGGVAAEYLVVGLPFESDPGRPPTRSSAAMGDARRGADLLDELVWLVSLCLRDFDFLSERAS